MRFTEKVSKVLHFYSAALEIEAPIMHISSWPRPVSLRKNLGSLSQAL